MSYANDGYKQDLRTGVFGNQEEVQHLSSRFLFDRAAEHASQLAGWKTGEAGFFFSYMIQSFLDVRFHNRSPDSAYLDL